MSELILYPYNPHYLLILEYLYDTYSDKITQLDYEYDINITSVVDHMSDGSAECFSLVRAMSDYVQLVNSEKVKNQERQFRNRTKH